MDKRGCIIVTCRDRDIHRDVFLLYMNRYFSYIPVLLVEQVDKGSWNKGLLYNAAFTEIGHTYDYVILHDIDFIPSRTVDYSYTPAPTLISTQCSQFGYGQCYPNFFGGVIGVSREHYELVNGFSNSFTGWGGEDDLFYNSFIQKGITPVQRSGNRFENFTHPRPDARPGTSFYNTIEYQNNLSLATTSRDFSEGLSTSRYKLISNQVHPECTHIRIDTCQ